MRIENKINFQKGHNGSFWAEEVDAIVSEITNTFRHFFIPRRNSVKQMAEGIVLTSMSNFWYGHNSDNVITLVRRDGLPIPDYYDGLVGHFKVYEPNSEPDSRFRFMGKVQLPVLYKGEHLKANQLLVGEIFFFHIELSKFQELVMNIYPVTLAGEVKIAEGSGKMVTSPPIRIVNGRFKVETPINGDIVFNRVECYIMIDGILTSEYDTKRGSVNEADRREIIIENDESLLSVDGRYAIISYTI